MLNRDVNDLIERIRSILNEWDFLPGTPDDEYDCMIGPLVHLVRQKASRAEFEQYLREDCDGHFSVHLNNEDADFQNAVERLTALL